MIRKHISQKGFVLPTVLSAVVVLSILVLSVAQLIELNLRDVTRNVRSQEAFNIAEAGINYYLWHMSHNGTDYKDGKSTPATADPQLGFGPYVHTFYNDNQVERGTFTLWIKPQGNGSTVATVRSIGKVKGTNIVRTIDAQIGAPSFASYGVVSDSALWFGNTETANGPIHSNEGIRMDGASNSDVTSSNATYVPSSSYGGNGSTSRPGVWCSTAVTTPVNCNTRSKTDWRYPVPSVDFNQVSSSLCNIKKVAFAAHSSTSALANLANACSQVPTTRTDAYLPQRATNGSYNQSRGYLIILNSNNTYDLYQVNGETDTQSTYLTALTESLVASNITIPSSGVIFAEDNVWVRTASTFSGRLTIAAGRLATSSNAQIVIADDIVYGTKNGTDSLGLIAEGDVTIAPYAPPASGAFTFEVNAAIISMTGNVLYPNRYRSNTNACTRGWVANNQTFAFYGSVATRSVWTWTWLVGASPCGNAAFSSGDGYVTGIKTNTTQYDYNLLYNPPPNFPITSSYNILSWREVVTQP